MRIVISHWDADGLACVSLFFRKFSIENSVVYYTSATNLKTTLCKAIAKTKDLDELFIFDIAPNEITLKLASVFKKVTWIDHHKVENEFEKAKNIELISDINYKSCTSLVAKVFFNENNVEIAKILDEIDANNVVSEEAKFLRDLVSAIKFRFRNNINNFLKKFLFLTKFLSFYSVSDLMKRDEEVKLVENYRRQIEEIVSRELQKIKRFEINDKKILVLETISQIPVYEIFNRVEEDFDILAILIRKFNLKTNLITTKIELRSKKFNVFEIAKSFNGGGHLNAAGATIDKFLSTENFIEEIKKFL